MTNEIAKPNEVDTFSDAEVCILVYHKNCIDGATSAACLLTGLRRRFSNVVLYPSSYSKQDLNGLYNLASTYAEEGHFSIVVVDFSLTLDLMEKIYYLPYFCGGYILDHHKTAFEMYFPDYKISDERKCGLMTLIHNFNIELYTYMSGAGIAANHPLSDHIYKNSTIVKWVEDWDLWKFSYGQATKNANAYLSDVIGVSDNFVNFMENILKDEVCGTYVLEQIQQLGHSLFKKAEEEVDIIVKSANLYSVFEVLTPVVVCESKKFVSRVGNILADRYSANLAVCIINVDATVIEVSLRSVGDVDVSAIAKEFGGGGHKHAAGFLLNRVVYTLEEHGSRS